jgi:hypothetical protein
MAKYCVKCKGLLVQGAETCIICGKTITPVERTASIPKVIHISQSSSPGVISDTQVRFVTPPGGKPVNPPASIPNYAPIPPFKPSAASSGPYIRFVTAPGGRRVEDTSTAKSYKTRYGEFNNSR